MSSMTLLQPTMSTFGTVLAYCLLMYHTIRSYTVSRSIITYVKKGRTSICTTIVWHKLGKVDTVMGQALCTLMVDRFVHYVHS